MIAEMEEERLEEHEAALKPQSAVDADFLVALKSAETTMFPAIKAQYDFDLIFNYGRLVEDYHDINLRTGVT